MKLVTGKKKDSGLLISCLLTVNFLLWVISIIMVMFGEHKIFFIFAGGGIVNFIYLVERL